MGSLRIVALADAATRPRSLQTFPGAEVLKDISWEVKKGERVGLVGWNGAGKTTQLKIITGEVEPDKGEVIRVKSNMNIAYLTQEFELVMTRTVREEFLSAFGDSLQIIERLEAVQKELEKATDDMERMVSGRQTPTSPQPGHASRVSIAHIASPTCTFNPESRTPAAPIACSAHRQTTVQQIHGGFRPLT